MKLTTQIKIEEAAMFVATIVLFYHKGFTWWLYPLLIFSPDLSMLGYLVNTRIGALTYNIAHNKAVAIIIWLAGVYLCSDGLIITGMILFGHSSMDRLIGYGLKFSDDFKHTHLGWIGKKEA